MKKRMLTFTVTMVFSLVFLMITGCNDGGSSTDNDVVPPVDDDSSVILDEDTASPDEDTALPYPPETPKSYDPGDIAANITFYDTKGEPHKMEEFYKSKKLLWLIISAYDCPGCIVEKGALPKFNKQAYLDQGFQILLIMNGYLRKASDEPTELAALKESMTDIYGKDADFFYGYIPKSTLTNKDISRYVQQGFPSNTFINCDSMEVLEHWEGWDESFEAGMDVKIDYYLSEIQ